MLIGLTTRMIRPDYSDTRKTISVDIGNAENIEGIRIINLTLDRPAERVYREPGSIEEEEMDPLEYALWSIDEPELAAVKYKDGSYKMFPEFIGEGLPVTANTFPALKTEEILNPEKVFREGSQLTKGDLQNSSIPSPDYKIHKVWPRGVFSPEQALKLYGAPSTEITPSKFDGAEPYKIKAALLKIPQEIYGHRGMTVPVIIEDPASVKDIWLNTGRADNPQEKTHSFAVVTRTDGREEKYYASDDRSERWDDRQRAGMGFGYMAETIPNELYEEYKENAKNMPEDVALCRALKHNGFISKQNLYKWAGQVEKIWLCPTYDIAVTQKGTLEAEGHIVACSEAEYGELEVTGSRDELSLAHHGPREANPAPCLAENMDPHDAPTAFLVSHIDLDAVGGILALQGIKPEDDKFWEAAAFIDVNGIHHIHELDQAEQDKLNAVYAWNTQQDRLNTRGVTEPIDVTEQVNAWKKALDIILDPRAWKHDIMINAGREWEQNASKAVEEKLVFENENLRAFITDGVFCSASYYSPNNQEVAPATVVYNKKFDSITIAFEDGGKTFSAKEIVQAMWGPEAGGHGGIAGSPRGRAMTEEQFIQAVSAVNAKYEEKRLEQSITLDNIRSVDTKGMSLFIDEDVNIDPSADIDTLSKQLEQKYQIAGRDGTPVGCPPDSLEMQIFVKGAYDLAQRNAVTGAMVGGELKATSAELLATTIEDSDIALQTVRKEEVAILSETLEDDVRDAVQTSREPKTIDDWAHDDEVIGDNGSTQDDEGLH